ncbi:FUSC family protein [Acidicapsa acidisoli]|uniref:FUSC family protein n=1 Tax=Acidicapsa acidisoli TaxID=1615681 RepID=UPI0021E0B069|nr:FUSC family protein [Acidicapsa acidisoli]
MQLSSRRNWSQETLALKLPVVSPKETGFLTFEKRAMMLLAAKTALAAGLCYWLAKLAGLQDGYWGSISAIIVLQSNVGSTVTASRDRLIGTLIGAAYGAAFSFLGVGIWPYLAAVIVSMMTCSLLGLKNSSRLAGVTVTILMLVHRSGSNWTMPAHRVLEVLLGIVVALGISTLVLPSRARMRLRDGLTQEYLLMGALFAAILEGFRGKPAENLTQLWKDVDETVAANGQLLDEARNEPSGGPASLEGLSMLHQFGLELGDLLNALGLAVKDSSDDQYAARLEPELGRLAADIHRGFQYVAGCIHRWRFDEAPTGLMLEDDITAMKAKMAEIQPASLDFPQSEILRVYAVQLHLKQLARLLRSSRIETNRAVG